MKSLQDKSDTSHSNKINLKSSATSGNENPETTIEEIRELEEVLQIFVEYNDDNRKFLGKYIFLTNFILIYYCKTTK